LFSPALIKTKTPVSHCKFHIQTVRKSW